MSYRLINANALAMDCKEVNDMPCIYADLPNGLDGGYYDLARAERTCIMSVIDEYEYEWGEEDWKLLCTNCGDEKWYRMGEHPDYCPKCGARVICEWES